MNCLNRKMREIRRLGKIMIRLEKLGIIDAVGDTAEELVGVLVHWNRAKRSNTGFDGRDPALLRVEAKGRRIKGPGQSRINVSDIRNLDAALFDWMAIVIFNKDFLVWRACLVPYHVVLREAYRYPGRAIFYYEDRLLYDPDVIDITKEIKLISEDAVAALAKPEIRDFRLPKLEREVPADLEGKATREAIWNRSCDNSGPASRLRRNAA
jgi:hypothetical protein